MKVSLHSFAAGNKTCGDVSTESSCRGTELTKASHISIERSFVSEVRPEMVKFLATVDTRILNMMHAKFCPPQTREPVPKAIMCWDML